MNLNKLIESRKMWNELSDDIYKLAAGDLDNSPFYVIYYNYENDVLDELCRLYPKHAAFLKNSFCAIILDIAQEGYAQIRVDDRAFTHTIHDGYGLGDLLESDYTLEYKERY